MLYAFSYPFFPEIYSTYIAFHPVNWEQLYTEDLLVFIVEGNPTFFLNDQCYNTEPGDVLYVPTGTRLRRDVTPDQAFEVRYIHLKIPGAQCSEPTQDMIEASYSSERFGVRFSNRQTLVYVEEYHKLRNIFPDVVALLDQIRQNDARCLPGFHYINNALLMQIFGMMSTQILENRACSFILPPIERHQDRRIRQFTNYIYNHVSKRITLADLCEEYHFSPQYIITLFRKHTHMTPLKYIASIKILYAKEIMRRTNRSIKEIAQMTGFENQHYFSRVFQSFSGCTPSEYLRRLHAGIDVAKEHELNITPEIGKHNQ